MTATSIDAGAPLDCAVRAILEQSFQVDLSGVRLHSGPRTDELLRRHRHAAAAIGHQVFVGTREQANSDRWLGIVAHEVAHTIQQANGIATTGGEWEHEAHAAARAVLAGRQHARQWRSAPRAGRGARVLAGFNSWEHQLLCDLSASDLLGLVQRPTGWQAIVTRMVDVLALFREGNMTVTAAAVHAIAPDLQLVDLGEGMVATRGELAALGDYVANVDAIGMRSPQMLFTFLQTIREDTFNHLLQMRQGVWPAVSFAGAPIPSPVFPDDANEVKWLDKETRWLGPDHYRGLLARNACHFVPFSWSRWRDAHGRARDLAAQAFSSTLPARKARLTNEALIAQGYADHFFQDCFAPGHLTNKTMVMMIFARWANNTMSIPVLNWDAVREVTVLNQPGLCGWPLYARGYSGPAIDPQTGQEATTIEARMEASGVQGYGKVSQRQAYYQYLALMRSSTAQLASKFVHDYYNATGRVVRSDASTEPFTIYGDGMLFDPKNLGGLTRAKVAVEASWTAINDILRSGTTQTAPADLLSMLPTQTTNASGQFQSLQMWQDDVGEAAGGIFEGTSVTSSISNYVLDQLTRFDQSMGLVSNDELYHNMTLKWRVDLKHARVPAMFWDGDKLFVAFAGGYIYELDPNSGVVLQSTPPPTSPYLDVELATDGVQLFVGGNAQVASLDRNNLASPPKWTCSGLEHLGNVLAVNMVYMADTDRPVIYAGTMDGYVYEIDAVTGENLQHNYFEGFGNNPAMLAVTAGFVVVGISTQWVGLARTNLGSAAWVTRAYPPIATNMNVMTIGTLVYCSCGADLVVLDPEKGAKPLVHIQDDLLDVVTQATDGTRLFRASMRTVIAYDVLALNNGEETARLWTTDLFENVQSPPLATKAVTLLAEGGRLFAAADHFVFMLDPRSGEVLAYYGFPVTDRYYPEINLATDGVMLFCGGGDQYVGGWVAALSLM